MTEIKTTMATSNDKQEHLEKEIVDIKEVTKGLQDQIDQIREGIKSEKQLIKEASKYNLSKYVINDEIELSKVKREAERFH